MEGRKAGSGMGVYGIEGEERVFLGTKWAGVEVRQRGCF
jgi:hypothetical protein